MDTSRSNPPIHWDGHLAPLSGFLTLNQFFARYAKPGMRPVAAIGNPVVVVLPVDAVFIDSWRVCGDSTLYVENHKVDVKGVHWSIRQLIANSAFADPF